MRTEIKEETIEILKSKGFVLSESRFPYTYHHDYVRENTGLSREDIALMLRRGGVLMNVITYIRVAMSQFFT